MNWSEALRIWKNRETIKMDLAGLIIHQSDLEVTLHDDGTFGILVLDGNDKNAFNKAIKEYGYSEFEKQQFLVFVAGLTMIRDELLEMDIYVQREYQGI